jgi:hypothetical protein
MALPLFTDRADVVSGGTSNPRKLAGTADPSAGGGVAAPEGSTYQRFVATAGEVWTKIGAADTAWYRSFQVASTTAGPTGEGTVRTSVPPASAATPIVLGDNDPRAIWDIEDPPDSPNANDAEFDGSLGGFTENFTVSGSAIDPYAAFGAGNPRRSLDSYRRGWYMLQPPADSAQYLLHKAPTIPADVCYWARCSAQFPHTSPIADDASCGIGIFATSAGLPDTNNYMIAWQNEADGTELSVQLERNQATVVTTVEYEGTAGRPTPLWTPFICLQKISNVYHLWGVTVVGNAAYVGTLTWSGAATLDRLCIVFRNASTSSPGTKVMGIDFFRQVNGTLFLP